MQLTFEYYCPHCKYNRTVEGSPGYYQEQGFVECVCGKKATIKEEELCNNIDT